ncbi:MAG: hypothetical protein COA78_37900 [Blastopirellula sp.]|nr:MAG: hypothetical protein COA78_37900 [Blastopirellula sp.]
MIVHRVIRLSILTLLLLSIPSFSQGEEPKKEKDTKKVQSLFDGKELGDWKPTVFGGEGDVYIENGAVVMAEGVTLSGIHYTKDVPKINYELRFEARRMTGTDFFAGVTFPVNDTFCSFIPGGWGGAVVGLSSIDGKDASENETTKYIGFKDEKWFKFRIRVTKPKIQVWIDGKLVIDQKIEGHKISTRAEVSLSKPLGFSAWQSTAELRKIELELLK